MKHDRSGAILITSLWILTILSLTAIGIGFRVSLELRLSKFYMDRLKALYLAKAGIVRAQELLSKDNNGYDSIYECGVALTKDAPRDLFMNIKLGDGYFNVTYRERASDSSGEMVERPGMMDEERHFNINISKTPYGNIADFKNILKNLSPKLPDGLINAIIDWQDIDSDVTFPGGAEDSDYEREGGYSSKDADLEQIEELALVKGMTLELFNEIREYITVYGNGKVNINTASEKVMHAIGANIGLTDAKMDDVIGFRNGTDGARGSADDGIFNAENMDTTLFDLGLSAEETSMIKNYFTTESHYFRIESIGVIDRPRSEKRMVSVVHRDAAQKGGSLLISYHEY